MSNLTERAVRDETGAKFNGRWYSRIDADEALTYYAAATAVALVVLRYRLRARSFERWGVDTGERLAAHASAWQLIADVRGLRAAHAEAS